MIALLHTLEANKDKFEKIIRKVDSKVAIKHFVNENLLKTALATGQSDSTSFKVEIEKIKKENPSLIICTCSTYGEDCDKEIDVYRIDRPIAEYIVQKYTRIGLAYAATSTKKISERLLLDISSNLEKDITILNCDCTEFWPNYEAKNYEAYEKGIAEKIKSIEPKVDVVFLAQASMENTKKHLSHLKKEVLASPEFGILQLLKLK
ncbi:hypothetical protein ACFLRU_01270 [Bacteroidota bacterium]